MLYLLRSDGAYVAFDGMTQNQITAMLNAQGLTAAFITKEEYDTAIQAAPLV